MCEDNEGAGKRRRHLNPDELPGRPFDEQGEDDEQGSTTKKKRLFFGAIADWMPIVSQRLSTAKKRLFPSKREPL